MKKVFLPHKGQIQLIIGPMLAGKTSELGTIRRF